MARIYSAFEVSGIFVGLVWRQGARLERVFAASSLKEAEDLIGSKYPGARRADRRYTAGLDGIIERIKSRIEGRRADFPEISGYIRGLTPFRRRIYENTMAVSRGKVASYGALAKKAGDDGAARAVGRAMRGNPYPLIIPCHRIVRTDGTLGGFSYGAALKVKLLKMEGITFNPGWKIPGFYFDQAY